MRAGAAVAARAAGGGNAVRSSSTSAGVLRGAKWRGESASTSPDTVPCSASAWNAASRLADSRYREFAPGEQRPAGDR